MQRVTSTAPLPAWLQEVAELLALGYLRARKREAARVARELIARNPLNGLPFIAMCPPNGTGDPTTET